MVLVRHPLPYHTHNSFFQTVLYPLPILSSLGAGGCHMWYILLWLSSAPLCYFSFQSTWIITTRPKQRGKMFLRVFQDGRSAIHRQAFSFCVKTLFCWKSNHCVFVRDPSDQHTFVTTQHLLSLLFLSRMKSAVSGDKKVAFREDKKSFIIDKTQGMTCNFEKLTKCSKWCMCVILLQLKTE